MKTTQKFYKMPQALFSDKFSQLSNDAKILYMLLLNRKSLSEKNDFNDENGNTVVLFQIWKYAEASVADTIRRPRCFGSWKSIN